VAALREHPIVGMVYPSALHELEVVLGTTSPSFRV